MPETLRAIVQEFVTRDGTDHSAVEERIAQVLRQIDEGLAELHFEQTTGTCNIVTTVGGSAPRCDSATISAATSPRVEKFSE